MPLIGLVKETVGMDEFVRDHWPASESLPLVFDDNENNDFFRAMNGRTMKWGVLTNYLFGGRVKKHWKAAGAKGITGNWEGEGYILGGLAVVAPGGAIRALWREEVAGDHAAAEDVVAAAAAVAAAEEWPDEERRRLEALGFEKAAPAPEPEHGAADRSGTPATAAVTPPPAPAAHAAHRHACAR